MFSKVRCASIRLIVLAGAVLGATVFGSAEAEEPSFAQLIEGVRNLTTTDPELSAFSVRISTILPFEVPFETTAVWHKEGDVGLLTTQSERGSPALFLSNSQSAFFDVCTGNVLLEPRNGRLRLKLQSPAPTKLKLDFGIGSGDEEEVEIDFRSLLDNLGFREGVLSRPDDGALVLEAKVSERGNRTFAYFDEEAPHSLRSLELRGANGEGVLYVYDIKTNAEVDVRWPPMPAPEDFPPGVRLIGRDQEEDAPAKLSTALLLSRVLLGYGALHNPKWREGPVAGVDWNEALKHSQAFESLSPRLMPESFEDANGQR
ncbi:MAG TPA: hypothetical protein VGN57_19750 [Pirellulaceae bacterium]|jgi:hypothetical protein|nr:hypothetical protein [Pirellulaceae bacterium]